MKSIIDQIGRDISIASAPLRIVSLSPPLTELLCSIGLEKQLVGITDQCIHPFHLKSTIDSIGCDLDPDLKKIQEIKPDLIVCDKAGNGFNNLVKLEAISATYFSNVISIEDSINLIHDFGRFFNCRTESENLIQKINFKLSNFSNSIKHKPQRKVAYFTKADPWMAVGNETYTNTLLTLNKFENIYSHMSYVPKVEIERLRFEGDPEVIILANSHFKFNDDHAMRIGSYSNRSITVFSDIELFTWFGPRLLKAIDYFTELQKRLESHF